MSITTGEETLRSSTNSDQAMPALCGLYADKEATKLYMDLQLHNVVVVEDIQVGRNYRTDLWRNPPHCLKDVVVVQREETVSEHTIIFHDQNFLVTLLNAYGDPAKTLPPPPYIVGSLGPHEIKSNLRLRNCEIQKKYNLYKTILNKANNVLENRKLLDEIEKDIGSESLENVKKGLEDKTSRIKLLAEEYNRLKKERQPSQEPPRKRRKL